MICSEQCHKHCVGKFGTENGCTAPLSITNSN